MRTPGSTLFVIVLAKLLLTSCAAPAFPPFGGTEFMRLEEDEKRLWTRSEEEQNWLDRSGLLYEDPALIAYVNKVARRLIPEKLRDRGLTFQVRLIKNPLLNAFSFPNGVIYMHTGLLAKMENEAQLATVLAHEMTHVTHRHLAQQFRVVQSTRALLATLQVLAAQAGYYGNIASLLGQVGAVGAVSGYSKAMEREADQEGLELLVKAGYDPEEAPKVFEYFQRELEEQKKREPFFFGSHPRLQERKESYAHLLQSNYKETKGDQGRARFQEMVHSLILHNALMDLAMGRFGMAKEAIERFLSQDPESAAGRYYLGETYRQRAQKGDNEMAEKEYHLAIDVGRSYAEPYRGLGLIYHRQGLMEKAREAFDRYLSLAPQAKDKEFILQHLKGREADPSQP